MSSSALLALGVVAGFVAHCGQSRDPIRYRGQSGSEVIDDGSGQLPGGDTVPCPCGSVPTAMAVLRVTLLRHDVGPLDDIPWCRSGVSPLTHAGITGSDEPPVCARLRLRVEEVLRGDAALAPGDEIDAVSDGILPCFLGLDKIIEGEQALAAVNWPRTELAACEEADACAPPPELSPQVLREHGTARLTRWGDSLVFAQTAEAQLSVPASELGVVFDDFGECRARFGDWASLPGAFPGGLAP